MHNVGIFFLWALAACILFDGFFAKSPRFGNTILLDDISPNQTELRSLLSDVVQVQDTENTRDADIAAKVLAKLDSVLDQQAKLERQLQEVQTKMEAKLDESLLAVQKMIENQFQAVVNQLQLVQNKTDVPKVVVPPGFELIGNRYFRIVNENVDWKTAERRCREMGGYLAAFQNEEEINAIKPKLLRVDGYWLDINDRDNEGHFVSVASHKPPPFLKWFNGQPNDSNHEQNCVYLSEGTMGDFDCNGRVHFICQADNET